ncbi:ATP-dependent Clp protease ATP-binding subunit, partial [Candidatus Nomurabacteria bacterium]|nr:ATP-dependent Clp protease ATP-binding subunit [Candidatus Nomurabacteria bacterium]
RESELGFYATTSKQREKLDDVHAKNAEATREELEKMMRPELINRFDAIVTFQALTRREISKIFDNLLNELNERLVIKGLRLTVKPEVKRMIIDRGFNKKYGARPLRRAMQDMLEHPVAEGVLAGKFTKGMLLTAEKKGKSVVVSEVHEDK